MKPRRAASLVAAHLALASRGVTPVDLPLKPDQINQERRTVEYQPGRPESGNVL